MTNSSFQARAEATALQAELRDRLAVPANPLTMVANGLAWRSVWYCFTSIIVGWLALVAGIVGFVVLPLVAGVVAWVERRRVRFLGLPRLDEAEHSADGTGTRIIWARRGDGSNVAVWGSTVLFGLVSTVLGGPLMLGIILLVAVLCNIAVVELSFWWIVSELGVVVVLWVVLTISLYIAWGLASSQARAVHAILKSQSDLTDRVTELTQSRSELVDVFETERRRIERDLHDGAQQHLVVSTMRMGEAVYWLDQDNPGEARVSILTAQQSIEDALAALRDTIRGLHPQVLTERGLVAAVSELAARQPLPVTVRVEGQARPLAPALENAAYHVASEALTNVIKYAAARQATVTLAYGHRFVLSVSDDGVGGAARVPGHGLSGLAESLAAMDGTLEITSPAGGPTLVVASLPVA